MGEGPTDESDWAAELRFGVVPESWSVCSDVSFKRMLGHEGRFRHVESSLTLYWADPGPFQVKPIRMVTVKGFVFEVPTSAGWQNAALDADAEAAGMEEFVIAARDWIRDSDHLPVVTSHVLAIWAPQVIEEMRGSRWAEVAVANLLDAAALDSCLVLFGEVDFEDDEISRASVVAHFGCGRVPGTAFQWAHTEQRVTDAAVERWVSGPDGAG